MVTLPSVTLRLDIRAGESAWKTLQQGFLPFIQVEDSYLEESSTWIKTKLISLALPGGPTFMALAPLWSHLSGRALFLVHQPLGSPPLTCSFLPWDCDSLKCYLCIQAGWRGKNWVCDRCTKGTRKPAELLVDQILMECKSQGSE